MSGYAAYDEVFSRINADIRVEPKNRVYLGGPINGCSDEDCKQWRHIAKVRLESRGYIVHDPMERDYRGRELAFGQARRIVESDLNAVEWCDILLIHTDRPSWGTACEMHHAYLKGKDIRLCWQTDQPLSPWPHYEATKIFRWLDEALADLCERVAA